MANAMYGLAKQGLADKKFDWVADTWRAYLIDTNDYTADLAADEFLDDIPSAARVAYVALTGMTNVLGVLDAADAVFSAVSGDPCEALVIVHWNTNEADSELFIYLDSAVGLPVTPAGNDITVTWDNGANKIVAI